MLGEPDRRAHGRSELMVGLIATARRRPATCLGHLKLVVTDLGQNSAERLVLDDGRLRHLPQLVENPVRKLEALVGDRPAAIGIVANRDPLAAQPARDVARLQNEHHLVGLQGQVLGHGAFLTPREGLGQIVVRRQRPVEILGVPGRLAESPVEVGNKRRQGPIGGLDRADTPKPKILKILDEAVLPRLVGPLDAALRLGVFAQMLSMFTSCSARPYGVMPSP
jgi:hypothetical protein